MKAELISPPPWLTPAAQSLALCLLSNYQRAFGTPLIAGLAADASPLLVAQELFAAELVLRFSQHRIDQPMLLNVNVPDVAYDALRGSKVTRLGKRHKAEPVVKATNPRGDTVYWVGAAGRAQDAGECLQFPEARELRGDAPITVRVVREVVEGQPVGGLPFVKSVTCAD